MADCNAAPRAIASSAFIVVDKFLPPKISVNFRLRQPIRVEPPTISTTLKSAAANLASSQHFLMGASKRSNKGLHRASYSAAFKVMWKSKSSWSISKLMPTSLTPWGLNVFLAFSAAAKILMRVLGFSIGLAESLLPYFSSNF